MLHGRSFAITLLALALLATTPLSLAVAPKDHDTAQSTGTSGITGLAIAPTGQFATAVLNYAAASSLPSCNLLLCPPSSASAHQDFFFCDFTVSASGCTPNGHGKTPSGGAVNTAQAVDAASFSVTGGIGYSYAIAGPGDLISAWSFGSATPVFEYNLGSGSLGSASAPSANTVSIAPDGQRILFGSVAASGAGILHYYTGTGDARWGYALVDAQQNPTNATSIAWARSNARVAIGTPAGLQFLVPSDTAPSTSDALHPFNTTPVNEVAISAAGDVVAAATNGYTYFVRLDLGPSGTGGVLRPVFSRQAENAGAVSSIAMTQDGERFASASGNKISFFHALHNSAIAQFDGDYDAGAPVTDLAYDGTGRLLVASAGANVMGFGPDKTAPIWSFEATARGLDLPLSKVRIADGYYDNAQHPEFNAQRIVVAGRTKVMAFDSVTTASASLTSPSGNAVVPGIAVPLTLAITNTGSLVDNYTFVVVPPVSGTTPWTARSAPVLRLGPDESGVANLDITAPLGSVPANYTVTVEVHAQGYSGKPACGNAADTIACPQFSLNIARVVALSLRGPDEKRLLKQGAEDTIGFTITNTGNADGVVNLSAAQLLTRGSQWKVHFSPSEQVPVPAGSSVDASVTLTAPSDAASGTKNIINITASEGITVKASKEFTIYVDAQFGSELSALNNSLQLAPGEVKTLTVNVHNLGNTDDLFNITFALSPPTATNDWRIFIAQQNVTVPLGQIRPVAVTIRPLVAEPRDASLTLTATSQGDPRSSQSSYVIALFAKPAVTTTPTKSGIPGPEPLLVVGLVVLAALARRLGGRR